MILACSHTCADKGSLRNCTRPDLRMGSDKERHNTHYQCTQNQATCILNLSLKALNCSGSPVSLYSYRLFSSPYYHCRWSHQRRARSPHRRCTWMSRMCSNSRESMGLSHTRPHLVRVEKDEGGRCQDFQQSIELNNNDHTNMIFLCICAPWHVLLSALRRNPGLQEQEYEPGTLAHSCWQ